MVADKHRRNAHGRKNREQHAERDLFFYAAPQNWTDGTYPAGEDDFPVNYVFAADAEAYCAWLTERDGVNTCRLPNESEWELAAGHMPKDADFNCGVNDGRTSVEEYAKVTRGAHGAVDFWGSV
ncbi:MAG: formylglycine-generating enzyme family protein [Clostridiales bacterium]|nr:formylglycine-generating enzyme family protein [Clostridiales bacterium]